MVDCIVQATAGHGRKASLTCASGTGSLSADGAQLKAWFRGVPHVDLVCSGSAGHVHGGPDIRDGAIDPVPVRLLCAGWNGDARRERRSGTRTGKSARRGRRRDNEGGLPPCRRTRPAGEVRRPPPSADAVVDLLKRMANPEHYGREDWASALSAARGCIVDLEAEGDDEKRIADAACWWTVRWARKDDLDEATRQARYDEERKKWDGDWSERMPLGGWAACRSTPSG